MKMTKSGKIFNIKLAVCIKRREKRMKKNGAAKLISMLLSLSLALGNTAVFEVHAKEEENIGERTSEFQGDLEGVLPDNAELISQEEAEDLQEAFRERKQEGEYKEAAIDGDYVSNYGYNTLDTAEQREVYGILKEAAYSFHKEYREAVPRDRFDVSKGYIWGNFSLNQYQLELEQVKKVLFAVEADCPELFWLTGDFNYGLSNGTVSNFFPQIAQDYQEVEVRKTAQKAIQTGMVSYLEAIDKAKAQGQTDWQIEQMIHDMIILAIDYAYVSGTQTPEDADYAHSIVGVFDETGAVCEGYAKAFQLLMNYAGVESIYAVGYGNGGGHAWNLVCLEGEWYNVDITWDDMGSSIYHDGVRYLYFNRNTAAFGNHVYMPSVFPEMYQVPETSAEAYDYYKYYGLYVTEENVASREAFCQFFKNTVNGCEKRGDYLLQFYSENAAVYQTLISMISSYSVSALAESSTTQNIYKMTGKYFYNTTGGYMVYFPIVRIYADAYQVPYHPEGAKIPIHVLKGRREVPQEGNYTVSYSDNLQAGTAQATITGIGDYTFLTSSVLEYTILSEGGITAVPTLVPEISVSIVPSPTATEAPEPTITVSPEITVTKMPTLTVTMVPELTVTDYPSPTATEIPLPTMTKIPDMTVTEIPLPSESLSPTETPKPTNTEIPKLTNTEIPKPTNTEIPKPTNTEIPKPTNTVLPEPTNTPASALTKSPTNSPTKAPEEEEHKVVGQVTGVKFVSATNSKIKVAFQKQAEADGYEISLWKGNRKVKTVITLKNIYTFQKLSAGTDYTVRVRAYTEMNGKKQYAGYSKKVKAATAAKAPSIICTQRKNNQAVIQWKKVKNSSGYEVYMSARKNSGYKKVAVFSKAYKVKYIRKQLEAGKTYYFKVRTYRKVSGRKLYSPYSNISKIQIKFIVNR